MTLSAAWVLGAVIVLSMAVFIVSLSTSSGAQSRRTSASPGDAAACSQPLFPPGTPPPTSISGPKQVPPGSGNAQVTGNDGSGATLAPDCQWIVDFPTPTGDPTVTFTQYSQIHMNAGTQYGVNYVNNTGVTCHLTVEALNGFGGGGAQETLNSGNCNTDGYAPGEGSVQGFLTNGATGPLDTVASFSSTVTSFASGANIAFGFFNACSENPVGSHTNYACNYFYGGPSL
jgi:hypothetical protein